MISDACHWTRREDYVTPGCYYLPHLRRMPERSLRVLEAMAQAPPGRVLFHCQVGPIAVAICAPSAVTRAGIFLGQGRSWAGERSAEAPPQRINWRNCN